MPANNGEPSGFSGLLWIEDAPEIDPQSWLADPLYGDCRAAYEYAADHFGVFGQLLRRHNLSPEDACLIWKCIDTGSAVARFRQRQGRAPL